MHGNHARIELKEADSAILGDGKTVTDAIQEACETYNGTPMRRVTQARDGGWLAIVVLDDGYAMAETDNRAGVCLIDVFSRGSMKVERVAEVIGAALGGQIWNSEAGPRPPR